MEKRYNLDRFEGDMAVLISETGEKQVDLPRKGLPGGAKAGDTLVFSGADYTIDRADTEARAARIQRKMADLLDD